MQAVQVEINKFRLSHLAKTGFNTQDMQKVIVCLKFTSLVLTLDSDHVLRMFGLTRAPQKAMGSQGHSVNGTNLLKLCEVHLS